MTETLKNLKNENYEYCKIYSVGFNIGSKSSEYRKNHSCEK